MNKLLFRISKLRIMGVIVRFIFHYSSFLIPVKRIHSNKYVMSFYHPRQFYKNHILCVPKRSIRNITKLHESPEYFIEILASVNEIVDNTKEYHLRYFLCTNGGRRQEVPQLHFHLFTAKTSEEPVREPDSYIYTQSQVLTETKHHLVIVPSESLYKYHFTIIPKARFIEIGNNDISLAEKITQLTDMLSLIKILVNKFQLSEVGYTVFFQGNYHRRLIVPQIVAGKRQY